MPPDSIPDTTMTEPVLEIRNLVTHFESDEGVVKAVDGVTLSLERGKTLGVVGESGCGKSVMVQSILQIVGPTGSIKDGEILLHRDREVVNLTALDSASQALRDVRGGEIAIIFQEPMTAFSPVHTIGWQIREAILHHEEMTAKEAEERVVSLLGQVGIPDPEKRLHAYPFELSGGMRQRAMIAMALACAPRVLIADEPTTALDVTIQAQILDLLRTLQRDTGTSIIFITHDMGVIAEMADDVVVMYLGEVVEHASVWSLFDNPRHPYTRALLESIPHIGEAQQDRLKQIVGTVPDPFNLPKGCHFHPRCEMMQPGICDVDKPRTLEVAEGHTVACVLYDPDVGMSAEEAFGE